MSDFIEVYDGAISRGVCEHLIRQFDASSHVVPGRTGHGVEPQKKDSLDITISDYPEWQDIERRFNQNVFLHLVHYMNKYRALLAGALSHTVLHPATSQPVELGLGNFDEVGVPQLHPLARHAYRLGKINIQKYLRGKGGYHHWHSEIYPDADALERVLFFQYYLNDVAEGGETEFLYQNRRVEARAGRLIIAPAGFTHTHKGNVPASGDKIIATSWILFQKADILSGRSKA
jgi:2OG-Fe(II) oxygenase superfamily